MLLVWVTNRNEIGLLGASLILHHAFANRGACCTAKHPHEKRHVVVHGYACSGEHVGPTLRLRPTPCKATASMDVKCEDRMKKVYDA